MTRLPCLGVVPMIPEIGLAEEDGAVLETRGRQATRGLPSARGQESASPPAGEGLDIAVLRLPRISNFDDFDALRLEPGVSVRFVAAAEELGLPDAVIIPGTKATIADLAWLRKTGLDLGVRWLARIGRSVLGVCGGYQMLGLCLEDPEGIEGPPCRVEGLGLLPVRTVFGSEKRVVQRRGIVAQGLPGALRAAAGSRLEGYEIHVGRSLAEGPPLYELDGLDGGPGEPDGAWAEGGRILGTYLHGLFDLPDFRRAWLRSIAASAGGTGWSGSAGAGSSLAEARDQALDRLADSVEAALDMESIRRIAGLA